MAVIRNAFENDACRLAEIEVFDYRMHFYPLFRTDRYFFSELNVPILLQEYQDEPERIERTFVYEDNEVVKGFVRVNGEEIDRAELPTYPGMGTVVTDDEEQVIIKIVNFSDEKEGVEITLDCDVEEEYTIGLLTGKATDENSLEAPEHVRDAELQASGASREFTYEAPGLSVSILRLNKKRK